MLVCSLSYDRKERWAPLHVVLLVNASVWSNEMWHLKALVAGLAADGTSQSLPTAVRPTIRGAAGSPVHSLVLS